MERGEGRDRSGGKEEKAKEGKTTLILLALRGTPGKIIK